MNSFYALPLGTVFVMIVLAIITWTGLELITNKNKKFRKRWRYANKLFFIGAVLIIVKMTLLGRSGGQRMVELTPFHTFTTMSYNNEAIRTLLMNVVLFLPLGLTLPYIFEYISNDRRRWLYCFTVGGCISVGVEVLQYYLAIGLAETDDIICNLLGCGLGILANVLGRRL